MPSLRGCGSRPIVTTILILLLVIAAHSASITGPRCNARSNSTVKITVIPTQRIRRADDPPQEHRSSIAPRCNARFNSTANATVIHVDRIRWADKYLATNKTTSAPKCNARLNSTISITKIQGDRFRRADSALGQESLEAGNSEVSGSDASSEKTPINYAYYGSSGRLADAYMRASDAHVTADLVAKGKLRQGEQLASRYTDVGAFSINGWNTQDNTPTLLQDFGHYVPFRTAFQSLGLSVQARPQGKNELVAHRHTLPWSLDGRPMQLSPWFGQLVLTLSRQLTST
jgi:hypothetical protein